MKDLTITVPLTFTRHRVCQLLTGALEGGSNYWMHVDREHSIRPSEPQVSEEWIGTLMAIPWGSGSLCIIDDEGDDASRRELMLGERAFAEGLTIMAQKYPRHFAAFVEENDDATTSDVFLQCCLFGELVYG